MKSLYLYELANLAGVSPSTMRSWIRDTPELTQYGYRKGKKILSPGAVQCLAQKYVIHIPDTK